MFRRTVFPVAAFILFIAIGVAACDRPPQGAPPDSPAFGYTLHIDAIRHINDDPDQVVHHYVKAISDEVSQALLYDTDTPNARLIGVEIIISPRMYDALPEDEKPNWHYHKTEIPEVNAQLPDLSEQEAAAVVTELEDTWGKVIIFWKPKDTLPVGVSITRPQSTSPAAR